MTISNRGFRHRSNVHHGRSSDEQSEHAGNRKTFDEVRVPPDNIGNKLDNPIAEFIHDGMGNSFEEEPTHLKSGILACLTQNSKHISRRRPAYQQLTVSQEIQPEEYFARLKSDFAKLLNTKSGLAFSFSMKPITDNSQAWEQSKEELAEIFELTTELLESHDINAEVKLEYYHTPAHRFAVFFIKPEESDASKNKELIAALRQVISSYTSEKIKAEINIFLVLANAQAVIEEHLYKIGAKKVSEETES